MGIFNWLKKDKKNKADENIDKVDENNNKIEENIDNEQLVQINRQSSTDEDIDEVVTQISDKESEEKSNSTSKIDKDNDIHSTENYDNDNQVYNVLEENFDIEENGVIIQNEIEQDNQEDNAKEEHVQPKQQKVGFFRKIANALKKTKDAISNKIDSIFHKELDDNFFDDLEEILITSDIGYETSEEIIERLRSKCKKNKLKTCEDAKVALREVIKEMILSYDNSEETEKYPKVIIVVGVNGVGKTTTIGKLANYYSTLGKKVVVVAGDTFRAAASAQLNVWASRADVKIVKQNEGADSASVVFDGISFAKSKGFDVVLVDTAGRLHNKVNLMEELSKVNRVATKNWEEAEFERYIVIDATTGQNAVNQVREFNSAIDLDGVVLTKLDGTAKGGIVVSICHEFEIPVKFVGVGEGINDIVPFDAVEFVEGII